MLASVLLLVAGAAFVTAQRTEVEIQQDKNDEINSAIANVQSLKGDLEAYYAAAEALANSNYDFETIRTNLQGLKGEWIRNEHSDDLKNKLSQAMSEVRVLKNQYQIHRAAAEKDVTRLDGASAALDPSITVLQNALTDLSGCATGLANYHSVDGTCFYVSPTVGLTWDNARADCQSKGMDLPSIQNAGQQTTVVSLLNAHGVVYGGIFRYWIGGHQVDNDNSQWYWAQDNSGFSYTNWSSGEPNNAGERCAMLWSGNRWNDGHCHNGSNMRYFCQQF